MSPLMTWVTYAFRTAHPILRWLPSKLAVWLAENMRDELAIPEKQGAKYTVLQLNSILASNLVPNRDGGHLRTFRLYNGRVMITGADQRPVATHLISMGIASVDKIPRYVLYSMLHKVLYSTCYIAHVIYDLM
jgi:hypothetical protein